MKETIRYLVGIAGPSGYGSKARAEQVTESFQFSSPFTAIITGATSGIGEETARVLAKRGVRIVMAARDMKKAAKVKERIKRESPEAEILVSEIDLSSLASVRRFCVEFAALGLPLNILINNGGVFSPNLEYSDDKFELTFATNYLGHYLLTELLLDKLIETSKRTGIQGRIINVSSVVHYWVKKDDLCFIHLLNPNKLEKLAAPPVWDFCRYNGTRAYAQSKLACILHAKEVARQLKGAATTCYVALSPQTQRKTGKYFADCNETKCSSLANDELAARTLWMQTRALILRELGEAACAT